MWLLLFVHLNAWGMNETSSPNLLAWDAFEAKDYTRCLKLGQRALEIGDAPSDSAIALGRCFERLGEFQKAHDRFTFATLSAPANPDPFFNKALMSIKLIELKRASIEIEEFKKRFPSDQRVSTLRDLMRMVKDLLQSSKMSKPEARRAIRETYLQSQKSH